MATTAEHIAARSDGDLLARTIAAAEMMGVPNATQWVQAHMGILIGVEVSGEQTISDIYAYAMNVRNEQVAALPPLPGVNPGAVTDANLKDAISLMLAPVEGPPAE